MFCRLLCLRVHPTFNLLHPSQSFVSFTSIDESKHEIWPEAGELYFEGNLLPNGDYQTLFYPLPCSLPTSKLKADMNF